MTRTSDLWIERPPLYPVELKAIAENREAGGSRNDHQQEPVKVIEGETHPRRHEAARRLLPMPQSGTAPFTGLVEETPAA